MKTYFVRQTKHQLGHYSSNKVIFKKTRNAMRPLIDENKIQLDEQQKP